jgi:hypothetical protein
MTLFVKRAPMPIEGHQPPLIHLLFTIRGRRAALLRAN